MTEEEETLLLKSNRIEYDYRDILSVGILEKNKDSKYSFTVFLKYENYRINYVSLDQNGVNDLKGLIEFRDSLIYKWKNIVGAPI